MVATAVAEAVTVDSAAKGGPSSGPVVEVIGVPLPPPQPPRDVQRAARAEGRHIKSRAEKHGRR
eukprot:1905346-Prymnesium_polylepis.1